MVHYRLNESTLVQMNAVIIFQKKPSRIDVIDENIENIKVIESIPQEKEKTKVNCSEMYPSAGSSSYADVSPMTA